MVYLKSSGNFMPFQELLDDEGETNPDIDALWGKFWDNLSRDAYDKSDVERILRLKTSNNEMTVTPTNTGRLDTRSDILGAIHI